MPTPQELEAQFWKALRSDMTVMLGLEGEGGHTRPMTAQVEDDRSPLWFFTASDTLLVEALGQDQKRAIVTFASKSHDLFATVSGTIKSNTDRAVIDRLWNKYVAAWYEGGKDDPKLVLLRLDADSAEVWLNENTLLAGIKLMLGMDPKEEYRDKVATVSLKS